MTPTHLDLFSGIGGFALAAQWAGFTTIGFAEIDSYASAILKKHWPGVPNYGDVRTVPAVECDLITGGFPCQPFSLAGQRRGKEDDRYLWPEMLRVIAEARPCWVLAENVPGIINMELDRVLSDLEGEGYATGTLVLPAACVGAFHLRNRVWIVANSDERAGRSTGNSQPRAYDSTHEGGSQHNTSRPSEDVSDGSGIGGETGNANTAERKEGHTTIINNESRWLPEPAVGRVAHGIPNRVHRLRCLGNAIVPQVAFQILKVIKEIIDTK